MLLFFKGGIIDSKAPEEKNKLTTGTLTWENIDNKAEYKASGHGISYSTGAGVPLNALGLLSNMGPTVKDKAGTTTRSAVSKGTITITDKENQKQDIEKLNRNTEDSLNKLKEIFDKTKVEERKQLLEELGIVGNRAIHAIASHNGWKDGSAEKVALHGMLGAITSAKSGGSALSGLIAGGANEYAIGYLEKSKGKDWINKHPDTVQNISAAFGGILSQMTGGSGHTGAYISQIGTKWNLELDEHSKEKRQETYEEIKDEFDKEYIAQLEEKNSEPINLSDGEKALNNLNWYYENAVSYGITPLARELLGAYLDQDFYAHGASVIDYTNKGYKVVEFGENSVINRELRNDINMNKMLILKAYGETFNSSVDIPTYVDSYNFYTQGVDRGLSLGRAAAIISIKREGLELHAKITILDNWDNDKKEAEYGGFVKDAYLVQQSGVRDTFAWKTTYDVTVELLELLSGR